MPSGISTVSIAVAEMQRIHELWVDQFGMELVAQREGSDSELARLWGLNDADIARQILLRSPGAQTGQLHFVELRQPGPAVRATAKPYDLGAKNLDVNCSQLPERIQRLSQAGYTFRSELVEYKLDEVHAREVQMPAHDGINVAFIEVLSDGFVTPYTEKGFAALTSFVVVVDDINQEAAFYRDIFKFKDIMQHRLSGPDIEKVIGLPKGASVQMHLLGQHDNMFGRMELIHYEGLKGADLFATARAPATGILSCGFCVESIEDFVAGARNSGILTSKPVTLDMLYGRGSFVHLRSPAGLELQVFQAI